MLAWWDEPPQDLYACVRSMRVVCDAVVAVDGAYEMTPGATRLSPDDQPDAIRKAAHDSGMDCTIAYPEKIWTGQVEKRNFMLQLACRDSDWVVAVDADHRLTGDREAVRAELERVMPWADSVFHRFYTPLPEDPRDVERLAPHEWHKKFAGKSFEHSLVIRVLDDMRVEESHWGYTGTKNGHRVTVGAWKHDDIPAGQYHTLAAPFQFNHVCFQRDVMRLNRNRDYCEIRDRFVSEHGYEP